MRLLMTTDTVGGVWSFTGDLTRQLLERGHAVHLVSFGRQPSPAQLALIGAVTTQHPEAFHFTSSPIALEWMQDNEHVYAEGSRLLLDLLGTASFDLILSNQFCFGRLETAIPRIVVAHSDVLSWARACSPSTLEGSPWLHRYTSLVQGGILSAAALVTPTAFMGKALKSSFFLPTNSFVIPNGTDVEATLDTTPIRKLQAITAGRLWDEGKGLAILQDLDPPMPLLIAGDNVLDSPGQQTSWPNYLTDLGPLSRPALHQRFRESAIYLCTSLYEPFGLAPLEAALCGCAVVARDLPSLREVWADNALYFNDSASLQATLNALATRPDLLAQAQHRALERAGQYTPERMTDAYLHLFGVVQKLASQVPPHVA